MRTVTARSGLELPVVGMGTYRMGEDPARRAGEIAALRLGLELGMTLVDTAEMYADGGAERVVAEAIRGRRDGVVLVSKVLPENATRDGVVAACERSLRRLGTDHLDLYLLHWPSRHPIETTIEGFAALRERGLIRHAGVSNFDVGQMRRALLAPDGSGLACNQVLYGLARRWAEWELAAWCEDRGVALMASTPLERGRILDHPAIVGIARRRRSTPARVALAWCLRRPRTVVVVKASDQEHVRDNAGAAGLFLSGEDLVELDAAFPPPAGPAPLEIL